MWKLNWSTQEAAMRLRRRHHAHVFEGVSFRELVLQWQPSHLGQSRGSVKSQKKMVLIIAEKDKRRRRWIMKRQRGGREPGKNDEQFAFVLARKTRVGAECTWKWRRRDNQTTRSKSWVGGERRGGGSRSMTLCSSVLPALMSKPMTHSKTGSNQPNQTPSSL